MYVQSNNSPYIYGGRKTQKLKDVIAKLKELYCGSAAVNYTHLLVNHFDLFYFEKKKLRYEDESKQNKTHSLTKKIKYKQNK
jgi:2-oxoglutarate dehydrogenase complex dehydrogenase (E1) component-like enzyme